MKKINKNIDGLIEVMFNELGDLCAGKADITTSKAKCGVSSIIIRAKNLQLNIDKHERGKKK